MNRFRLLGLAAALILAPQLAAAKIDGRYNAKQQSTAEKYAPYAAALGTPTLAYIDANPSGKAMVAEFLAPGETTDSWTKMTSVTFYPTMSASQFPAFAQQLNQNYRAEGQVEFFDGTMELGAAGKPAGNGAAHFCYFTGAGAEREHVCGAAGPRKGEGTVVVLFIKRAGQTHDDAEKTAIRQKMTQHFGG